MGLVKCIVVEICLINSRAIRLHRFNRPPPYRKGGYRASISYEAFFRSFKKRNHTDTKMFLGRRCEEPAYSTEKIERNLPCIHHKDIWGFYEFIGYNYKKKKFEEKNESR